MYKSVALGSLILIMALVNWQIATKEKHIQQGSIIYLELAPVDPRSLMQGDYMALRFQLANEVYEALPKEESSRRWRQDVDASDGFVVVSIDERRVASFKSLFDDQSLSDGDMLLRYRVRNGTVKFATNAFFFQEGQAEEYERARYGQFRIDDEGELLLVAMHDEHLSILPPENDEKPIKE